MVKRQKEKQYQSAREQKRNSALRSGGGGSSSSSAHNNGVVQRQLPFHCCALTLIPFTDPVCALPSSSSSGPGPGPGSSSLQSAVVFDSAALTQFVLEHGKDPVTGETLGTKSIVTLHMDQDEEGRWQCPVLTKPFSDRTKIVAVLTPDKQDAYVYSYEAYHELNVKPKNWIDLTTSHTFRPKQDVLLLNDPEQDAVTQPLRDIQSFWHIREGRSQRRQMMSLSGSGATSKHHDVKHSVTATRIMEQIQKEKQKKQQEKDSSLKMMKRSSAAAAAAASDDTFLATKKMKIFSEDVTGVRYTSGKASGSLTSTAMDVSSDNATREASQEEILQAQFKVMKQRKEKGMVRLIIAQVESKSDTAATAAVAVDHKIIGEILLELHCDIAPRTCTNFLGLCRANKYDGSPFHRLIPNFMIQGGKPKAGGTDEASLWGPAFEDEFDDRLKHTGGGILSMANAGPKTNKRQFFLTFRSCPHLDRKHSIFGKVVGEGSLAILEKLQSHAKDKKDRPTPSLLIQKVEVLVDPAKTAEDLETQRIEDLAKARQEDAERRKAKAQGKTLATATQSVPDDANSKGSTGMIGKYLPKAALINTVSVNKDEEEGGFPILPPPRPKAAPVTKTKFGNFSSW